MTCWSGREKWLKNLHFICNGRWCLNGCELKLLGGLAASEWQSKSAQKDETTLLPLLQQFHGRQIDANSVRLLLSAWLQKLIGLFVSCLPKVSRIKWCEDGCLWIKGRNVISKSVVWNNIRRGLSQAIDSKGDSNMAVKNRYKLGSNFMHPFFSADIEQSSPSMLRGMRVWWARREKA